MSYDPRTNLGDFMTWAHTGAKDATTGSFDWTVDQLHSAGTAVGIDDSPGWADPVTGFWGYPVGQVKEEGVYHIRLGVDGAAGTARLNFSDAAGGTILEFVGDGSTLNADAHPTSNVGHTSLTARLPAGTHVDVAAVSGDPILFLLIQKAG